MEYADLGPFAEFDKEMERAIGVPVFWEDREFFLVLNFSQIPSIRLRGSLKDTVRRQAASIRDATHDMTANTGWPQSGTPCRVVPACKRT